MPSCTIREMTDGDYDAVHALWKATPGIGLSEADERRNIAVFLEYNRGLSFVAEAGGAIAGAVLGSFDGRRGYLHHLAVAPGFRRSGDRPDPRREVARGAARPGRPSVPHLRHGGEHGRAPVLGAGRLVPPRRPRRDVEGRGPAVNLRDTVDALATLGFDHAVLPSGSEGAVLVSPDCGRLLGLWPNGRAENALWTDPGFFEALRGAARREEWINPGGDRIWLGPDDEFLHPGTGTPPSVDPGRYVRLGDRDGYRMENRGDAWAARSGTRVAFRIERRFTAFDAKQIAAARGEPHLRQAGCGETTVLEIAPDAPPVRLRGIVQVPAGGETWIPLAQRWADTPLVTEPIGSFAVEAGCAVVHAGGRAPDPGVRRGGRTVEALPPGGSRCGSIPPAREGVRGRGVGRPRVHDGRRRPVHRAGSRFAGHRRRHRTAAARVASGPVRGARQDGRDPRPAEKDRLDVSASP